MALYLIRGWMEVVYIKATSSPYKASRSSIFGTFTLWVILTTSFVSITRTVGLAKYYNAPLDVVMHLQNIELPRLFNVINLLITLTPSGPADDDLWRAQALLNSEFDGMLPGHFAPNKEGAVGLWTRSRHGARTGHAVLNDRNQQALDFYVDISTCDYLIDSDFPLRQPGSGPADLEPRYIADAEIWDKFYCHEFLDAANSGRFSRLLSFSETFWKQNGFGFYRENKFGEYCLLRDRKLAKERDSRDWSKAGNVVGSN